MAQMAQVLPTQASDRRAPVIRYFWYIHFEHDRVDDSIGTSDARVMRERRRERWPTRIALRDQAPPNGPLVNFRSHWHPFRWSGWHGTWSAGTPIRTLRGYDRTPEEWLTGPLMISFKYVSHKEVIEHRFEPMGPSVIEAYVYWQRDRDGTVRRMMVASEFIRELDDGAESSPIPRALPPPPPPPPHDPRSLGMRGGCASPRSSIEAQVHDRCR